jgi:hypothetical protein
MPTLVLESCWMNKCFHFNKKLGFKIRLWLDSLNKYWVPHEKLTFFQRLGMNTLVSESKFWPFWSWYFSGRKGRSTDQCFYQLMPKSSIRKEKDTGYGQGSAESFPVHLLVRGGSFWAGGIWVGTEGVQGKGAMWRLEAACFRQRHQDVGRPWSGVCLACFKQNREASVAGMWWEVIGFGKYFEGGAVTVFCWWIGWGWVRKGVPSWPEQLWMIQFTEPQIVRGWSQGRSQRQLIVLDLLNYRCLLDAQDVELVIEYTSLKITGVWGGAGYILELGKVFVHQASVCWPLFNTINVCWLGNVEVSGSQQEVSVGMVGESFQDGWGVR